MPLAFTYPLMKRFTYWPQLFLGITFNYGLVLGWTAIQGEINAICYYLLSWSHILDTRISTQYMDIKILKDDEIIGIKSTSIKFKKNPKLFLTICYIIFVISLILTSVSMRLNTMFYFFALIPTAHLFFYQIYNFNFKNPKNCLKIFKSNNFFGAIILCNILIGKF